MASLALEDVAARIFTHCLPVCSAAFVKVFTWLPRIAWAPNAPAATLHKSFFKGGPVSRCGMHLLQTINRVVGWRSLTLQAGPFRERIVLNRLKA